MESAKAICQTCGWESRPYIGGGWKTPTEAAKAAIGGHRSYHPGHDLEVEVDD